MAKKVGKARAAHTARTAGRQLQRAIRRKDGAVAGHAAKKLGGKRGGR